MNRKKHVHHWLIEAPRRSAVVHGVCASCGRERSFPATFQDALAVLVATGQAPKRTRAMRKHDAEMFGAGLAGGLVSA